MGEAEQEGICSECGGTGDLPHHGVVGFQDGKCPKCEGTGLETPDVVLRTAFVARRGASPVEELPIPCEGDCETHEGPVRRVLHTTMAGSDTRSYCEAAVRKERERGFRVEYPFSTGKSRSVIKREAAQRVSRFERLHTAGEASSPEEQAIRDEWFLRGTLWGVQQAQALFPGPVHSQLVDEKAEALREFLEKKRGSGG